MEAQWLLWLALALAAGVVEILTLSLVFAMVAGGALAAAAVAAVTGSAPLSVLAFAVSTGLLLTVVRPPLLRYSGRVGPGAPTGVAALVGRQAVVTRQVSGQAGEVKLAGEIWSARAEGADAVLETGSIVIVSRIDGATARVTAQQHTGPADDPLLGDPLPGDPLPGDPLPGDPQLGEPPGDSLPGDPQPSSSERPDPALPYRAADDPPLPDPAALPGGEPPTRRPES